MLLYFSFTVAISVCGIVPLYSNDLVLKSRVMPSPVPVFTWKTAASLSVSSTGILVSAGEVESSATVSELVPIIMFFPVMLATPVAAIEILEL